MRLKPDPDVGTDAMGRASLQDIGARRCRTPAAVSAGAKRFDRQPVAVHEHHVPGNQTIVADRNFRVANHAGAVHQNVIANADLSALTQIEHHPEVNRTAHANADGFRRPAAALAEAVAGFEVSRFMGRDITRDDSRVPVARQ
jgi:phenylpropionate dioxygenase-like ring-hydroxylating dioxygenase large terminal subunit